MTFQPSFGHVNRGAGGGGGAFAECILYADLSAPESFVADISWLSPALNSGGFTVDAGVLSLPSDGWYEVEIDAQLTMTPGWVLVQIDGDGGYTYVFGAYSGGQVTELGDYTTFLETCYFQAGPVGVSVGPDSGSGTVDVLLARFRHIGAGGGS